MYSEQLLHHFTHPRNVGMLDEPALTLQVENPVCGDILRLSARLEGGVVTAVGYQVRGCTASIAAGSALTEWLQGRPVAELDDLTADELETRLGGLPSTAKHAAQLCLEAVRQLKRAASV